MFYPQAKINLHHLKSNLEYIASLSYPSKVLPVIKANAYGHGYSELLKTFIDLTISTVCVATYEEIISILNYGSKLEVLHLGKIYLDKRVCKGNIIFTINSIEDISYINNFCKHSNILIRCHIKVDTGMSRMGCRIEDFDKLLEAVSKSKFIKLEGIYSHLSCSDVPSSIMNIKQINEFENLRNKLQDSDIKYHLLNSGGLLNFPNHSFDFVRIGLSIYGVSPNGSIDSNLKPVMEFIAPVILVKNINKGDTVGYGCTFKANKNMKIAVIQCGYADGIPIHFSNRGSVFYKNYKFPIIGRVSMYLVCVDISILTDSNILNEVTLWGGEQLESRLEFISNKFNTIPYQYLTSLSNRVKRVYV
jgi:alanine racemase